MTHIQLFQKFVAHVMGTKMQKKIIILSFIIIGILLYVISYGIIVSSFEKNKCKKIIYFLYEPIEFLRCKSSFVFCVTEKIYRACGGNVDSYERRFFNTPRRFIEYYPNGQKKIDAIETAYGIKKKAWYSDGSRREDYDETTGDRWNFIWEQSGKIKKQSGDFYLKYPSGKTIYVFISIEYAKEPYVEKIIFFDLENRKLLPLEDMSLLPIHFRPFFLQKNE